MVEKNLRFVSPQAYIEIPADIQSILLNDPRSATALAWATNAAQLLNTQPGGIVFRIGKLRLAEGPSRQLAHAIAHAVCGSLQQLGAPKALAVEIDRPQETRVIAQFAHRSLLPHHDGGHCSYLTPSLFDDESWHPTLRHFSTEGFTTTQAHKLYQGIFIADPGEALSVTTFYDWIAVIRRAYARATGQPPQGVGQLAAWLGKNIRSSLELQPQHKSRYLSLTAALGSRSLIQHGLAVHYAESDFTPEEIARFPQLEEVRLQAAQEGLTPTICLLSRGLSETLGLDWDAFRAEFEICVPSERYDLLLGPNLTSVHGGLMGGPSRRIEPICFVIEQPIGEEYERWLAQVWRRQPRPDESA
jgi:hypothetical protein